jgi:hypothetical protein
MGGESLYSPELTEEEDFGFSLAASGNVLLTGARGKSIAGAPASGAAYIFERSPSGAWVFSGEISAKDPNIGDRFGSAVAVSGRFAAIGAFLGRTELVRTGAAYVFEKEEDGVWRQHAKLTPPSGQALDLFGASVAIDGERVVVGAFRNGSYEAGAAYVYVKQGEDWVLEGTLSASDPRPYAHFGISVAISGETVVVGADADDEMGDAAGAAYVFLRQNGVWRQQAKLRASGGDSEDFFGYPVDIDGNTIAVGSHLDETPAGESGAVYIFEKNGSSGWYEQARLVPDKPVNWDAFGVSVAILGDTVVAGAYQQELASGSIYVFKRLNQHWYQVEKVQHTLPTPGSEFGTSVDVSGNGFIAGGAPGFTTAGLRTGNVYVLNYDSMCQLEPATPATQGILDSARTPLILRPVGGSSAGGKQLPTAVR